MTLHFFLLRGGGGEPRKRSDENEYDDDDRDDESENANDRDENEQGNEETTTTTTQPKRKRLRRKRRRRRPRRRKSAVGRIFFLWCQKVHTAATKVLTIQLKHFLCLLTWSLGPPLPLESYRGTVGTLGVPRRRSKKKPSGTHKSITCLKQDTPYSVPCFIVKLVTPFRRSGVT